MKNNYSFKIVSIYLIEKSTNNNNQQFKTYISLRYLMNIISVAKICCLHIATRFVYRLLFNHNQAVKPTLINDYEKLLIIRGR